MPKNRQIIYRDKTTNQAQLFSSSNADITIVCLPALGVRATYYESFLEVWQSKGFNAVTIDWRGNGHSSERPSRKNNWGYEVLVQDLKAFLEKVNDWFPNTKKVLVGHSLGGQLGCLLTARYPQLFDKIIIIACCLVHHSGWQEMGGVSKIKLVGNIFYPVSKLVGHFPGTTIGFGGKEAQLVMKDWCHNALTGKYELENSDFDYETALKKVKIPFLAINIEGDNFAPVLATENLYQKLSSELPLQHFIITKKETVISNLNHFNWAKNPDYFVEVMKNWLLK